MGNVVWPGFGQCCSKKSSWTQISVTRIVAAEENGEDAAAFQSNDQPQEIFPSIWVGTEFDIPEDAYGAAILALVKDRGIIAEGKSTNKKLSWMRFLFPIFLLTLNLVLQFVLLLFIFTHVVQPAVEKVQTQYKMYHEECFASDGTFLVHKWHAWKYQTELCQIAMTNKGFLNTVLFIWIVRMITEFRESVSFFSKITNMPTCDKAFEQVETHTAGEYIVALTRLSRLLLYLLVCIPKLIISIVLLMFGCRWLSATTSFENLVMNTVAMEFVTQIDETLFNACVPQDYRNQVRDINFFIRAPSKQEDQDEENKESCGFASSVLYFIISVLFVYLYPLWQDVLPHNLSDIIQHCVAVNQDQQPLCNAWGNDKNNCYPFGRSNTTTSVAPR